MGEYLERALLSKGYKIENNGHNRYNQNNSRKGKMCMKLVPMLLTAAVIFYSGPAQAGPFSDIFNKFDHNKDGKITFDESKKMVDPFFNAADLNKDDQLSPAEQKQAMQKIKDAKMRTRQLREYKRQDSDGNGVISRQEMHGHLYRLFSFMDVDNNQGISLSEMRTQSVKIMFDSRFN